jgi:DNA-binding transcriptional ArsR family regulator
MSVGIPSYEAAAQGLPAPSLFGSRMRTALLMLVAILEDTYPAEISRYLGSTISAVQRTLDKLEEEGVVATRRLGVRRVALNPNYPAFRELRALLLRLAEGYSQYQAVKESRRTRPRRRGKL